MVFLINGSGGIYTRPGDEERIALPNRQPQILPQENSGTDSDRRPISKWTWVLGIVGAAVATVIVLILQRKRKARASWW